MNLWRVSALGLCFAAVAYGLVLPFLPRNLGQATWAAAPPTQELTEPFPLPPELLGVELLKQSASEALAKSQSCIVCHGATHDPHGKDTLYIGCVDCHGGDPASMNKDRSHVQPKYQGAWKSSANPVRSYTLLNRERPEFVRFVNPGDLRIAHISCGTIGCHPNETLQVKKSMMTHGCMLWGAALYNNGAVPHKKAQYGESYSMGGTPLTLKTVPPPSAFEKEKKGVLERLDPLPRFEIAQPGNILRIFETGGRFRPEVGIPELFEDPGRPILNRLSTRGLGTQNRTDPVFLGLQKTRLHDPTLNFLGTNDHAGDYRSSGCTACHMVYANDRSRVNSGPFAQFGNKGRSSSQDPTIPKNETGHPIEHKFAKGNGIPTSQCLVCHVHPGTTVMNSFPGFMWWDEETDAELFYPATERKPTAEEFVKSQMSNPNESAARNFLSDPSFLENLTDLNQVAKHSQFADFHGHGWAFRAVFRRDRKGHFLDHKGQVLTEVDNPKLQQAMRHQSLEPKDRKAMDGVPVHLMDIHLERGMHCVDCHFTQDSHGNTKLQQEVRAAVEIQCIDCHGTITQGPTLRTSGVAAYTSSPPGGPIDAGRNLEALRTASGKRRFERHGDKIIQNSMVEANLSWEVPQTIHTITPGHPRYSAKSHLAKTARMGKDGTIEYGPVTKENESCLAHQNSNMSCIACHTSWNPSCFGCHLPQKANAKAPMLHNEGTVSRNQISYCFQTLREDVFMLGRDSDVTGNRIGPARSSCAISVGSYNNNRESIYYQQQTISAMGLSGIAFSTNVPHTVRGKDGTKQCTDCHLAKSGDNNAIMAQLLMLGTGSVNFIGRYAWVAQGEHGLAAVEVTERDEPQTVKGSSFQKVAYPQRFDQHRQHNGQLEIAHHHTGSDIVDNLFRSKAKAKVQGVFARGEYLYAACGEAGLRVFDIAFTDHKGFSERVSTAPVSPLGQKFFVSTRNATSVCAPTTMAPDPTREATRLAHPENKEPAIPLAYGFLYVTDLYEGVVLVNAATLLDGDPTNNFLKKDLAFNPNGILNGAKSMCFVGTLGYVCCEAGLVVVDFDNPTQPRVVAILGDKEIQGARAVQAQFRYAFVCDEQGVKVLDITHPQKPQLRATLPLNDARNIYLSRTYAFVAGGSQGLVILDIEKPESPKVDQIYDAKGTINDLYDVKLGITYSSQFAYLADGKNGMKVVQLTSPDTPGSPGFSPRPTPVLIARHKSKHGNEALAISRGLDRDRAMDESGHQIAVFGRLGARPLSLSETQKMYLNKGVPWFVEDDPKSPLYLKVK